MSSSNLELQAAARRQIIAQHRLHASDTGSPEVQVGLFSGRIISITAHLQTHPKDFHSRRGLLKLVGKRRRLLDYLKTTDIESYRAIVANLELRR